MHVVPTLAGGLTSLQALFTVPVLMKEMRSKMRDLRAQLVLGAAVGLTILVALLITGIGLADIPAVGQDSVSNMAGLGRALFLGVTLVEFLLCLLIAPAVGAGAIVSEREHNTLEPLLLTRLSGWNIAVSKLLSTQGYMLLILLCTLPVEAIVFMLGGVSPKEFFSAAAVLVASALLFGAIGLYCSVRFRKMTPAVILAYLGCLGWIVYLDLASAFMENHYHNGSELLDPPTFLLSLLLLSLLYAWVPAVLIRQALSALFRRAFSLVTPLITWLGLTIIGSTIAIVWECEEPIHAFVNYTPEYVFIGNPLAALLAIFTHNQTVMYCIDTLDVFYDTFSYDTSPSLFTDYFVPLTVLIMLIATALLLLFTARWLEHERKRQHLPA